MENTTAAIASQCKSGADALIMGLQVLLAQSLGTNVDTECGAATLSISHDRVTLTDVCNRVVADAPDNASEHLGGATNGIVTVLDPLATKLVRWYGEENAREVVDIVNGTIAGELAHLREEIEGGFQDDTHLHIAEYVTEAVVRRRITEGKSQRRKAA